VLLAIALIGIFAYARLLGSSNYTRVHMSAVVTATPGARRARCSDRGTGGGGNRFILPGYSVADHRLPGIPIGVMVLYSFNKVTTGLPQVSFA